MTIALNCVLLFLVLFFVYPLKFMFSNMVPAGPWAGRPSAFWEMSVERQPLDDVGLQRRLRGR